ncbi:hypothetical protein Val02_47940 [Virgisporangium aliadipatigenens]|uniref:Peptidoglycan binding-like domain-containing protein n=1 Tax=Virgisporangium aliadipatigenens TaxID=741659 RepID=A0A8J4DSI3_9ACTN|nr:peptidoglycan-binding protein [Virgisporangium aliadipatigenens]GIJ47908.1 hypothetical protein Val02_47940 [Virgisporangium aliadipatigenens]
MANENLPTVSRGDTGEPVCHAQRALRRNCGVVLDVDGDFGPATEQATKDFQKSVSLPVTGIVDDPTWKALPDGSAMPVLRAGSVGDDVRGLQRALTAGAVGLWETTPQGVDGEFGPNTEASVRAFQAWAGIDVDGVVGVDTWGVPVTLEAVTGLQHVVHVPPDC